MLFSEDSFNLAGCFPCLKQVLPQDLISQVLKEMSYLRLHLQQIGVAAHLSLQTLSVNHTLLLQKASQHHIPTLKRLKPRRKSLISHNPYLVLVGECTPTEWPFGNDIAKGKTEFLIGSRLRRPKGAPSNEASKLETLGAALASRRTGRLRAAGHAAL
ncbi:hypothetical protein HKT47_34205, partial [Pseudomonas aeruginosa]|uniref:hypothetical protein n=1 Tax=Pseudomonas aeruginosa TaxID=287 RepID=UPI00188B56B3